MDDDLKLLADALASAAEAYHSGVWSVSKGDITGDELARRRQALGDAIRAYRRATDEGGES